MPAIKIICPCCHREGDINIDDDFINNSMRGIITINISNRNICEHSFIVYVDNNFQVRDYFLTDFQIVLPEIKISEDENIGKFPLKEKINLDLIILNIPAILLTYVLKSVFTNIKIVIIIEQIFLKKELQNLFKYSFQNSFNNYISIIEKEIYEKNEKKFHQQYKNHVFLEGYDIIRRDKIKAINPKKLKVERQIIHNFLSENDSISKLITLKNEILKVYKMSETIIEFNKNLKKKEEFTSKKILLYLEEIYKIKIQTPYLNFLLNIVKSFFEVKLSISSATSNILGY